MTIFLIALLFFFLLEILYFKIAAHFNIIDKPNLRSSHSELTIRGGGILFPIALISGVLIFDPLLGYLAMGVFLIALISFLDDMLTLSNRIRIGTHVIAVGLILYQISIGHSFILLPEHLLFIPLLFILLIGIINVYNFMDGINGITVLYSLVSVCSLGYVQYYLNIHLLDPFIFYVLIASLLVFCFFNMRKKAKTFAGDVGSISMALILCFLIFQLLFKTQDYRWILILGIYGLDSSATVFCRALRKENIFEAHRSHFYQFLVNEKKLSHVTVAMMYAFMQLFLNVLLICIENGLVIVLSFTLMVIIYILIRLKYEGKQRLFNHY